MAGVSQPLGAFVKLEAPVEYDAIDGAPVDLIFGLLVPEEATQEHLDLLGFLAAVFSDAKLCARLRGDCTPEQVLNEILHFHSESA
jgi:PTS system nitrogen regulatory IIA component